MMFLRKAIKIISTFNKACPFYHKGSDETADLLKKKRSKKESWNLSINKKRTGY